MFNEEVFKFDIDNIKNDLAIEGMDITENDVNMYRMLAENEVAMPELINMIKEQILKNILFLKNNISKIKPI